ncbi:MAG TPA: TIGR02266 family protein [Thermoanaerobaculia bacterium]|jgi:uncharacterized protein (TIGR02266 family)
MVDYSNIPRDSRRVPLETRVQFKFDRFSGFISEYSANISPGGMFIRTRAPQPPGTVLDLEFRLGDGFELITGRGEVVWMRAEDEGPTRPAGMGIRFLELSQGSQELIYRIVDQHILHGGTPFDVTQRPPDLTPASSPSAAPPVAAAAVPVPFPDIFDLPPAPSLDGPGPGSSPTSEPFPELLSQASPEPAAAPPAPIFSTTFGAAAARRSPRRALPWVLLAVGLALVAGAFLLGDRLAGWIGLGGGAEISQAAPPVRPAPEPTAADPGRTAVPTSAAPPVDGPAPPTPAPLPTVGPDTGLALTRLDRITWEKAAGGTDVVLWGDGAIPPDVYDRTRIDGNPPRELIRLSGIRRSYPQARVVVGTPELLQVRVGYHPEAGRGELHVVLDLARPNVAVTSVEQGPHQLRIRLERR